MRKETVLLAAALTAFLVLCDVRAPRPQSNPSLAQEIRHKRSLEAKPDEEDAPPQVRHHRGSTPSDKPSGRIRKRRGRCRRYAQRFYQPYKHVPVYVPNGVNYVAPNYVPPQYVVPSYYSTRCRNHCYPCMTSACRRRCPDYPGTSGTKATATIMVTSSAGTWSSHEPTATVIVTKPPCDCDEDGSQFQTCDSTGACVCKANYTGKKCNNCKDGYWKNRNKDCVPCNCNKYGSVPNIYCDKETGRCHCKEGITGVVCDTCKPRHYGTVEEGCKECEPCNSPGQICDPNNGKCVCPPLTEGKNCENCVNNAWGYHPIYGCKTCQCSQNGTFECDAVQGKCTCKEGYEGEKCNRCTLGYYGYPNCRKCNCNILGTSAEDCQSDKCRCDGSGGCRCKENVQGTKCDACKLATFGLAKENPKGCTTCFCFGRTDKCSDAHLKWDQIRTGARNNETGVVASDFLKLPGKFLGDLTTSYGGYVTLNMDAGYFTIQLKGNGVEIQASSPNKKLQLIESSWHISQRNPQFPSSCQSTLSRICLMVILQNVTSILIGANSRIYEVLLDKAKPSGSTDSQSYSIEKCVCPKDYTGLSCQDPNEGYFRYFSNDTKDKWIDLVVGKSKPCECNGKSPTCDRNTGFCTNCTQHTTGDHCQLCEMGYYKDINGNCSPCLCPSANEKNALSCSQIENSFKCNCKKGYKGQFCEKCDDGYFKNSTICEPCNCNRYGVIFGESGICDEFGICQCKAGFKGDKCDQCIDEREYIKNGICSPCDECVKLLFSEIDNLTLAVEDTFDLFKGGVTPPWQKLTTTMQKYEMLSEKYKNKKKTVENLLEKTKFDELEKKVENMQEVLKKENAEAKENIVNTEKLQNSTDLLHNEIAKLSDKLINTIETLEGFESKPISLKNALKKAKEILKEIKMISKKFDEQEDQEALNYCRNITQKVEDIYKPPANIPKQLLKDLNSKLEEFKNITASVERLVNKAQTQNLQNAERIKKFKKKLEKVKENSNDTENSVRDIISKINATNDLLHNLEVVYNDLQNLTNLVEFKQLEHRIKRQMEERPNIDELFRKAMDHVNELQNKINSYQSIFNFTKDEWKKINASGAYETLLNGMKEAKNNIELSRAILENATRLITPKDSENLIDKTNLAREYSDRLKQRIDNLRNISKSLTEVKKKLDKFKYSILDAGKTNNDLNQILHKMESEITSQADKVSKLEEAIKNSTVIIEDMEQIEKNVDGMLNSSKDMFFKKYGHYMNLTSKAEIDKLKIKLIDTRKYIENLNVTSTHFDTVTKFNSENKNKNLQAVRDKIEQLKNKVYYAKQAADTINVAMSISECRMTYRLPQMEVFQSLSIKFKCETCQLFKLSNADGEFNIAVDNNAVLLKFNDKNIKIANIGADAEKTINVEKLGSLLKMRVDTVEKSEQTDTPYYVIHSNDRIEVGSTTKINKKSYVYNVILNEKKIGLWKFSETEGSCTGETRDETEKQPDNVNTFFNGKGYTTYGKNSQLNPIQLTLGFDFHTFDENSLIYLATFDNTVAATDDNCAYIMLFLKNGCLNLIVKHSNGLNSTMALSDKSNNGRKHHVDINMEFDKSGIQYYFLFSKNDTFEDKKNNTNNLSRKNLFKIKQASHYIGGVPPVFNKTCVPIHTSFLGFLKLTTPLINEVISYGTVKTGKQVLEFHTVLVDKGGYLKMKLMKKEVENISFIVQPTSPDGAIMKFTHYKIYLDNYKLKITDVMENDYAVDLDKDNYNTVNISFKGGILTVNRNEEKIQGPARINIDDLVFTVGDKQDGFTGGLRNILINNEELLFTPDSVIEFSDVEIGREPRSIKSVSNEKNVKSLFNFMANSIQNTESCAAPANFQIIPETVKFGDASSSYTHIKSNFWKNNYTMSFQFRTFDANGVLFISVGNQKQQHYNILKLTEGQLGLFIRGKKNQSPIIFKGKLNDGQWHKVYISKKKRKLTIALDDDQKKLSKIPKNVVRNEIFFGDVPSVAEYLNSNDLGELHPFRGCLKNLIINGKHELVKSKDVRHVNTRQCFANTEDGAYFNGSAFAVFREDLKVNNVINLNFEFKTAEQNGIFLSIVNDKGTSGLSIELQNGAVVMEVFVENGATSTIRNNLGSNFALCNNMWHNVTAMYSSELTVFVDGISQTWAQAVVNPLLDEITSPVYIGGFPENNPVTISKPMKNFKGCIRNLEIQNRVIDWTSMKTLNNVSLNACPV